jgi:predicted small secreted protein
MKKVMIVLAAAIVMAACNNGTVETSATKSVDSAAAAVPDTIKPMVLDSAARTDSGHRKL